jgi:hypothetical protein
MKFPLPLPDKIVRLIAKRDRVALGIKTADEVAAQAAITSEKELHRQVAGLLRIRDIVFFDSRMDRKSTVQIGMPDFVFCFVRTLEPTDTTASLLRWPVPCCWELKIDNRKLEPAQELMFQRLTVNGWKCSVIRSVAEAVSQLKELGL